jgi:hypothetical protein
LSLNSWFNARKVPELLQSLCLVVARFSLAAWVGAATLFIVTSIREVRSSELDSATRSILAAVRFPSYYGFGFSLLLAAGLCFPAAWRHPRVGRVRMRLAGGLGCAALVLMTVDYFLIYPPLAAIVAQPAAARPASFTTYHTASMWINAANLLAAAAAGMLLAWPGTNETEPGART